jgi:hypothetical protein
MNELQTSVRRLVTRSRAGDVLGRRLQLSQALNALDWSPRGLSLNAILCVRRLADPRPGAWLVGTTSLQPTSAWCAELSKSLEQHARSAARPACEPVRGNADAVVFADYAELLACLAFDWYTGNAFGCWWWKALFPMLDVAEAVRKAWTDSSQHVPSALCRLDRTGRSEGLLRAFSRSTASQVLENVLSAFGLTELHSALMATRNWPTVSDRADAATGTETSAPWSRWVKIEPSLPPEQRNLLIICAMLERAPGVLRSPGFARTLRASNEIDGIGNEPPERYSEVPAPKENVAPRTSRASNPGKDLPDRIQSDSDRSVDWISIPTSLALNPREMTGLGPAVVRTPEGESSPLGDSTLFAGSKAPTLILPAMPISPPTNSGEGLAGPAAEIVATEWGGVFYLVNVALALELYADFTTPLKIGLALPVWDFLALVGRRMIGPEFEADPLWAVLANLSGRDENDPPGQWFRPPEEWRILTTWLAAFGNHDNWRWSVAHGRLRLIHPQNFLVLDVTLGAKPAIRQMEDELRALGMFAEVTPRLDPNFGPVLSEETPERWLDWLVPYVQARLERALGVEHRHPLRDLVFRHQAAIEITAARVDVRFPLAKHPIELRLAGLDRDPGWVPAGGRTLAFHYD